MEVKNSLGIELVTPSEKFTLQFRVRNTKWNYLFFNFESVTQKAKNKSSTFELVTRSEI